MDKAKFKKGDQVRFVCFGKEIRGKVGIVDEMGTFFQTEEPSYDIWVNNENGGRCLYKHVRQRDVRKDENSAEE